MTAFQQSLTELERVGSLVSVSSYRPRPTERVPLQQGTGLPTVTSSLALPFGLSRWIGARRAPASARGQCCFPQIGLYLHVAQRFDSLTRNRTRAASGRRLQSAPLRLHYAGQKVGSLAHHPVRQMAHGFSICIIKSPSSRQDFPGRRQVGETSFVASSRFLHGFSPSPSAASNQCH